MRRFYPKYLASLLMIVLLAFASACSESERATCGDQSDCDDDQICRQGVCIVPSTAQCEQPSDCAAGYICVANQCARAQTEGDTGVGEDDTGDNTDVWSPPDTEDHDVPPDTSNPRVVSVFPTDGALNVETNTEIKVTFNKRMDHQTKLNHFSLKLRDPDGRDVTEVSLSYDEATETASITPTKPLRAAARYEIIVTPDLADEAGNSLYQRYTFFFYTRHNPPTEHKTLAEMFAPVIYQGVSNTTGTGPNTDIPTRVDFDGDLIANNNKTNAGAVTANISAHVYYHVTETESHYFVHYVLYYPARSYTAPVSVHEHDLTGINVTVDKETLEVLLVEGLLAEDTSLDPILSYRPESSLIRAQGETLRLVRVPDDAFEDGGKFPLFITSGRHIPCNWFVRGGETAGVNRCPANTQQFPGGNDRGVVLRQGESPQRFADATVNAATGLKEMTYKLLPFVDTFWLNRSDFNCGLYATYNEYKPDSRASGISARPVGAEEGKPLILPNKLCTNDQISFGKLPFAWNKYDTYSGGQWFLDPAFRVFSQYNLPSGTEISADYCQNIFFNIDNRTKTICDE